MREEGIKNLCLDRTWIISRASVHERVRTAGHCVPSELGQKPVALRKPPNNAPQSACGMDIGGCPQLGQHDTHAFGAIQVRRVDEREELMRIMILNRGCSVDSGVCIFWRFSTVLSAAGR